MNNRKPAPQSCLILASLLVGNLVAQSPVLLQDINPSGNADPASAVAYRGRVMFSATNLTIGRELYATNGTPAGTLLIADLWNGVNSSASTTTGILPSDFGVIAAVSGTNGMQFVMTDGVAYALHGVGTGLIDIQATLVGNSVYAYALGPSGFSFRVFRIDLPMWSETTFLSGTNVVGPPPFGMPFVPAVNFGGPLPLAVLANGTILMVMRSQASGTEIFSLAPGGTWTMVRDLWPGISNGVGSQKIWTMGTNAYFVGNDGVSGAELWKCDGSSMTRVSDINPGAASSAPSIIALSGDHLFFTADDGITGRELYYVADGSSGVQFCGDLFPGPTGSAVQDAVAVGANELLFWANDSASGTELYRSSSAATASLVVDFNPGTPGSRRGPLWKVGDRRVVFFASDGATTGLCVYDPTLATPVSFLSSGVLPPSANATAALTGGYLAFSASTPGVGTEMFSLPFQGTSTPIGHPYPPVDGPLLSATDPVVGQTIMVRGSNGTPSSLAVIVAGYAPYLPALYVFQDASIYVDVSQPWDLFLLPTNTSGEWSLSAPIPLDSVLIGAQLTLQSASLGASTPLGLTLTNGISLVLGN